MEQLAKNQLHTAEITGYTSDGAGVCHIAGRAVFVKGALAGETWQVRILKVTANAVYGKAEQCLSPAPARTQPPCPVYRTCGGCSLQHMDYDEQLRMKLQRVNDALTRIGGVSMPVQDIIGMEYPLCYRNKAIYAVGTKDGRVVKGFYRASSHDITPVEQCLLQLPLADKAAQAVCDWMDLRGVAPYDEATGRGTVRHLFTRCAMHTPDAVLCIVSARGFGAQTDDLIAYLREHCPELTGIVLDVNKQKGNVVLAGDFYPLWGVPELTDRLCGLTFTLSPQAFYQVNPVQAERLYERAVEYAVNAPSDRVLDLYCGAGTISLCLARKAAHVIGAEIVPEAIENARRNAERNGMENVEFLCADAGAAAAELARLQKLQNGLSDYVLVADIIGPLPSGSQVMRYLREGGKVTALVKTEQKDLRRLVAFYQAHPVLKEASAASAAEFVELTFDLPKPPDDEADATGTIGAEAVR